MVFNVLFILVVNSIQIHFVDFVMTTFYKYKNIIGICLKYPEFYYEDGCNQNYDTFGERVE